MREESDDEMSDSAPDAVVARGSARDGEAPRGGMRADARRAPPDPQDDELAARLANLEIDRAREGRAKAKAAAKARAAITKQRKKASLCPEGSADTDGWRCFHTTTFNTRCKHWRCSATNRFCTSHYHQQLDLGATNEDILFERAEEFRLNRWTKEKAIAKQAAAGSARPLGGAVEGPGQEEVHVVHETLPTLMHAATLGVNSGALAYLATVLRARKLVGEIASITSDIIGSSPD